MDTCAGWSVFGEKSYMDFEAKSVDCSSTGIVFRFRFCGALADTNAIGVTMQTASA
jgi:hypothetical protein